MIVYLDLDGTVLDTSQRYFNVYRTVAQELGESTSLTQQTFWQKKKDGATNNELIKQEIWHSRIDSRYFAERWMQLIESPFWLLCDCLQPNALTWLTEKAADVSFVLVTLRQDRAALSRQLETIGVRQFFDEILSDHPRAGPGWDTKKRLITAYARKQHSVIIGDTEIDVRCGKMLDIGTIGVCCGVRTRACLSRENPDSIAEYLADITTSDITATSRVPRFV